MKASQLPKQMAVLIVDDDQLVRDFAVHTIEYSTNREVVTFESGFQAWQFVQQNPDSVDMVIADANIPDMDGMELLAQIKKNYPQKVFIITASDTVHESAAYELGADAFISKPYDVDDLFTVVQQFLFTAKASADADVAHPRNDRDTPSANTD